MQEKGYVFDPQMSRVYSVDVCAIKILQSLCLSPPSYFLTTNQPLNLPGIFPQSVTQLSDVEYNPPPHLKNFPVSADKKSYELTTKMYLKLCDLVNK